MIIFSIQKIAIQIKLKRPLSLVVKYTITPNVHCAMSGLPSGNYKNALQSSAVDKDKWMHVEAMPVFNGSLVVRIKRAMASNRVERKLHEPQYVIHIVVHRNCNKIVDDPMLQSVVIIECLCEWVYLRSCYSNRNEDRPATVTVLLEILVLF